MKLHTDWITWRKRNHIELEELRNSSQPPNATTAAAEAFSQQHLCGARTRLVHSFVCYTTLPAKHWPGMWHFIGVKNTKTISLQPNNRTCDPREEGRTQEVTGEDSWPCGSPQRVSPQRQGPGCPSEHPPILLFPSQVKTDLNRTWRNLILGLEQSTPFLQITALSKAGWEKKKELALEMKLNMNVRYHSLFSSFNSLLLINDGEINCRKLMEQSFCLIQSKYPLI